MNNGKRKWIYTNGYYNKVKSKDSWQVAIRGNILFVLWLGHIIHCTDQKICFTSKVPIYGSRPKSDSAPCGAIWAQFKPKQPQQNPIKVTQRKSLGVYIRELAKKMASCIGALKRVRDYVPNTALQSILNLTRRRKFDSQQYRFTNQ